ncbi:MAG: tripartite tricarboxylate transporter TctB family protein [Ottowia sp.]|mgnify:FL=1|uniref:tripartite tricarboxylate transporter TctB family protein n=1 Tax=Ottowia sp. TaxID=1898956 RepID=UPI001D21DEF9|nr:tripartite tricarboxylate transporter TctB family protein [Ottowia sp.]MCP5258648.1 tripartite tricarboxylate transporter TctB family protein [Burkholderiaceae bacterium]MCB2024098.1 tripartite tricarboxylate transporter TctB family protein [Ottowia sp.]MCB2035275.1 tripartite tricarboxylate transporter TctB family protein [Ottowia sp.]MCB2037742.1 tripartite tricarboxylate transporter TctB family protein [Ottowia sp.]MCB2071147.1 tripartite tricarboxylate transporter TctB family protein [O
MNDQNLLRGLFLAIIAGVFGVMATRYSVGTFAHAGPGLFPLLVSCLLGVIAVFMVVRSRIVPKVPVDFSIRNIGIIMVALCGFVVVSELLNMIAGIFFLVFVSAFAGTSYSWVRNLKIFAVLLAVAFAFQKLLGLNLPLI